MGGDALAALFGPLAGTALVENAAGSLLVTRGSAAVLAAGAVGTGPRELVRAAAARAHVARCGDGGKALWLLTGLFLRRLRGIPHARLAPAWSWVTADAVPRALAAAVVPCATPERVVETCLSGEFAGDRAEAFVRLMVDWWRRGGRPTLRVLAVGPAPDDSAVVDGVLVEASALASPLMALERNDVALLVCLCPLTIGVLERGYRATVAVEDAGVPLRHQRGADEAAGRLAARMAAGGVRVVACTQAVHPVFAHHCQVAGITVLAGVHASDADALVAACGRPAAVAVSDLLAGDAVVPTGRCSLRPVLRNKFIQVEVAGAATLLLCAQADAAAQQFKDASTRALAALGRWGDDARCVAGGGRTEIVLAAALTADAAAPATTGTERTALRVVADAALDLASMLLGPDTMRQAMAHGTAASADFRAGRYTLADPQDGPVHPIESAQALWQSAMAVAMQVHRTVPVK